MICLSLIIQFIFFYLSFVGIIQRIVILIIGQINKRKHFLYLLYLFVHLSILLNSVIRNRCLDFSDLKELFRLLELVDPPADKEFNGKKPSFFLFKLSLNFRKALEVFLLYICVMITNQIALPDNRIKEEEEVEIDNSEKQPLFIQRVFQWIYHLFELYKLIIEDDK